MTTKPQEILDAVKARPTLQEKIQAREVFDQERRLKDGKLSLGDYLAISDMYQMTKTKVKADE
jgi:hypothetical protein